MKPEDIAATYRDGILGIVIPKAAERTSSKRIPVRVADENGTGRSRESSSSEDRRGETTIEDEERTMRDDDERRP